MGWVSKEACFVKATHFLRKNPQPVTLNISQSYIPSYNGDRFILRPGQQYTPVKLEADKQVHRKAFSYTPLRRGSKHKIGSGLTMFAGFYDCWLKVKETFEINTLGFNLGPSILSPKPPQPSSTTVFWMQALPLFHCSVAVKDLKVVGNLEWYG